MRWKIPASVLLAVALLVPAAPAVAQPGSPVRAATSCRAVLYTDLRGLVSIDLDTANEGELRLLAYRILSVATTDSLPIVSRTIQERLGGSSDDLRAFLKTSLLRAWSADLRLSVVRTLPNAGTNVQAAAARALDTATIDAYLAYLNHGLYVARAQDAGVLKVFTDLRQLVSIDLDTANEGELRLLAYRILSVATTDSLPTVSRTIQERLGGSSDDLRAFLKTSLLRAWSADLRLSVVRTLPNAGTNVRAAAARALDTATIDAYLAYLNHGLYVARAQDCAL